MEAAAPADLDSDTLCYVFTDAKSGFWRSLTVMEMALPAASEFKT